MKNLDVFRRIFELVGSGDPVTLRSYLIEQRAVLGKKGVAETINQLNSFDDESPLHLACYKGEAELVMVLLEFGGNASLLNSDGKNALHFACDSDGEHVPAIIQNLVSSKISESEKKALINTVDGARCTPLYNALWIDEAEGNDIVSYLLENGADPNLGDASTSKPIFATIVRKSSRNDVNHNNIQKLLEHGADYLTSDRVVGNAFYRAAAEGYLDAAKLIFDHAKDEGKIKELLAAPTDGVYEMELFEVVTDDRNADYTAEFKDWFFNDNGTYRLEDVVSVLGSSDDV